MDDDVYASQNEAQEGHWWYAGRLALFGAVLRDLSLPSDSVALDVGTAGGINLRLMRQLGLQGIGFDFSPLALANCRTHGHTRLVRCGVEELPVADACADLVLATDVVEHVEDDRKAVVELGRTLKPGGYLLLTVPAFDVLWGANDAVSGHKRRYRLGRTVDLIRQAGLDPVERFYFSAAFFLPVLVARSLERARGADALAAGIRSDLDRTPKSLNRLLAIVSYADGAICRRLPIPFGTSVLVLARKPV